MRKTVSRVGVWMILVCAAVSLSGCGKAEKATETDAQGRVPAAAQGKTSAAAVQGAVPGLPAQPAAAPGEDFAGEFSAWGVRVPLTNYYFVQGAISIFGTRWGSQPTTPEELDDAAWDQLVLSYEAFRRNIQVKEEELDAEVRKVLDSEKAAFDWKKDTEEYAKWVKEKLNVTVETFQNFLRHLLQLENLRKEMLATFTASVTEEEARAEFINEHNTIELEMAQFDEKEDADNYFKTMQDPKLWDEQNEKDPKYYKHPGFVSFEFLIFMWKIPKDDLYKMITMEENSIYPPVPVYKGYGVMRILKKRPAVEEDFPKYKDSYMKQVENNKKYEQLKEWQKQLKNGAGLVKYPRGDVKKEQ
ncbi:MAG TPA: hypothetical protein PLP56_04170 [Candidatus Omnitrophota bacterium]|nr:hypothetical protein [Candidatus Omnitrophota bacterium]HNQ50604.1 hypothetical protein [Candidatus Omnitrophota bacterium]HQO38214.1 hypothetical protein [Candidatus Omnitrophota bacterium]HQQ06159.1 hypothetical protein [Candidatus Omnitrophota bacterium]